MNSFIRYWICGLFFLFIFSGNVFAAECPFWQQNVCQYGCTATCVPNDPTNCTYACNDNPSCFLPGTKIDSKDGEINIEDVKVGKEVKSYDLQGNVVDSKVSQIFERERDFYFELKTFDLINGKNSVKVSAEHPFLTDKKTNNYTQVQYLKKGDRVFVRKGDKYVETWVVANTRIDEKTKVYNMSVDNTHTYFANGFAVHNKKTCNQTPNNCPAGIARTDILLSSRCVSGYQNHCNVGTAAEVTACCAYGAPPPQVCTDWYPCPTNNNPNKVCHDCSQEPAPCIGYTVNTYSCNSSPTFNYLYLKNNLSVNVPPETGNKNQICHSIFNDSRTINVTVGASDPDGLADITNIRLRWNGVNLTLDSFIYGIANFSHTFVTGQNNVNANDFEVNITDSIGNTTGWISAGRSLKVWDCNVSVLSAIFDGSAGQACNNTGFLSPLSINNINFKNMSGGTDATTNLVWSDSYLPLINGGGVVNPDGDLPASGRFTRIIDTGVGTTVCPSSAQFNVSADVSAYSAAPSIQVDLSYIRDQEGWFQGKGLDMRANTEITSGVPVTVNTALSVDNLAIGVSNNGMVTGAIFGSISGNNNGIYGIPNNWYYSDVGTDPHKYSYQTIYNDYFVKLGVGITGVTVINTGETGVMFVNGDLTISSNVVVAANNYLMVVVSGSINIEASVTQVDGIYVANGNINALGNSDSQLVINGILYSLGNIRLARSFTTKSDNNSTPAVVVNYRPNLIFAMPGRINQILL